MSCENLMRATLQVAVPLHIEEMKGMPWEQIEELAHGTAQIIAEKGDVAQFKSEKKGESAKAFNAIARGLAALSFCPGGVTFLGDHWETVKSAP